MEFFGVTNLVEHPAQISAPGTSPNTSACYLEFQNPSSSILFCIDFPSRYVIYFVECVLGIKPISSSAEGLLLVVLLREDRWTNSFVGTIPSSQISIGDDRNTINVIKITG